MTVPYHCAVCDQATYFQRPRVVRTTTNTAFEQSDHSVEARVPLGIFSDSTFDDIFFSHSFVNYNSVDIV